MPTTATHQELVATANRAKRLAARNERKKTTAKVVSARQTARDSRSPKQQLAELDSRLGEGVGATKERARLKKAA